MTTTPRRTPRPRAKSTIRAVPAAAVIAVNGDAAPAPAEDTTGNELIDPFNIDNVRYAEAEHAHGDIDAEKHINAIRVRKPVSNKEWFRVHPGQDYQMSAALFERETPESTKPEQWLVPGPLRCEFNPNALTPVMLRLAVTSLDVAFLWAVKRPRKGMRDSKIYYDVLDDIVEAAEINWVMIEWSNVNRVYDHWTAPEDLGDPKFPEVSMLDLLKLGFNGKALDRRDHPVILEHQGHRKA
jgi:hypothetical protein